MTGQLAQRSRLPRGFLSADELDIAEFRSLCETDTEHADYALATEIVKRVPVYAGDLVRACAADAPADGTARRDLMAEWAACLADGPGLFVVRGAFTLGVIDEMTAVLDEIIEHEARVGVAISDHYAKAGANTRVWNSIQKAALRRPETYLRYYSNASLALAAEAWLGPWYQFTAQVNVVHPGGAAQFPHRDYHLGFLTNEQAERFPAHVHLLSQALTLQVVIAHCEMPVDSGPTMVLPYSQQYLPGYVAWRDDRFAQYFRDNAVQFHLQPGDVVFLNPGVHHAAGTNFTADRERYGNLMQISSAFGVAMENIDHYGMAEAVYPSLVSMAASGELSVGDVGRAIAANAEGYPFPTNVDTDPPSGGLMTNSLAALTAQAVAEDWTPEQYSASIRAQQARRRA